jgi:flagellar biosynthesis protein FlhA
MIMRKTIAQELGIKIPSIHVFDNSSLKPYTRYNILIKDNVAASGELRVNQLLALRTPYTLREVEGTPTKDPIYGEEALWIEVEMMQEAKDANYMVFDPLTVLSTHLDEVVRANVHEFVQRQEVQNMLDSIEARHRVIIEEIRKKEIDLSLIQGVVQNMLRENVSIRDLPTILESIIDTKTQNKVKNINNIDDVTHLVREKLRKAICKSSENADGKLYAILPSNTLEREEVVEHHDGYYLNVDGKTEREIFKLIKKAVEGAQAGDIDPVILVNRSQTRFAISRLVRKYGLNISVLAMNELVPGTRIEAAGNINYEGRAS